MELLADEEADKERMPNHDDGELVHIIKNLIVIRIHRIISMSVYERLGN